jgi:transcriptional regulator with XRE-family HTH domain
MTQPALYIREFRQIKDISINDLAKITGLSPQYLKRLETGQQTNPSLKTVILIGDGLGISFDSLINKDAAKHG